ncbi:MAG TPA: hypothetical protein VL371_26155 [Gemmataceae bacterium]|nr:hypothetical protein [Gemmataceae bacterium]
MQQNDRNQNPQHTGSAQSGQRSEGRDAERNVTTNPREAGSQGGGTPLGEHGQDARTWNAAQSEGQDRRTGDDANDDANDQGDGQGDRRNTSRATPERSQQDRGGVSSQSERQERSRAADTGDADEQVDDEDDEFESDDEDEDEEFEASDDADSNPEEQRTDADRPRKHGKRTTM